jgi:hypothetical protein
MVRRSWGLPREKIFKIEREKKIKTKRISRKKKRNRKYIKSTESSKCMITRYTPNRKQH